MQIGNVIAWALYVAGTASVSAQALQLAPATEAPILRTGTAVQLKLDEQLSTKEKQVRVGQRFRMEVAQDLKINDHVVIPAGSPAMGEITEVRNKGMWGKSGHISAQVLYVQVNGRQIRMSGSFDEKGTTGTAGVVAAVVLIPLAGFVTTGTSAVIPLGAQVKGFVDEDVPLAFANVTPSQPAPMVVGGSATTASAPH